MVMITEKDINRKFINREGKICEIVAFEPTKYRNSPVKYKQGNFIYGRLQINGKVALTSHAWDFMGWLYEK